MAVTTLGRTKMKNWLLATVKEVHYKLDGVDKVGALESEVMDNDVVFYLMLGEDVSGTVTAVEVIDSDGEVFDTQPETIIKPTGNGLQLEFTYRIQRV